ncbi:unnamed protein product [Symbiodinium natans]|uniref:Uncharacterized protein n=1 Tax=Symbiodinium natans TaxID=878477 RepID=A0A812MBG0_9DINO|nr:unnamed protein product [Symbiodinium natans]
MVVAELLQWRAPVPLILLCVLVLFNPRLNHGQDLDFAEIFAGSAEVSAKLRQDSLAFAQVRHYQCYL